MVTGLEIYPQYSAGVKVWLTFSYHVSTAMRVYTSLGVSPNVVCGCCVFLKPCTMFLTTSGKELKVCVIVGVVSKHAMCHISWRRRFYSKYEQVH